MRVLICGSRKYSDLERVREVVRELPSDVTLVVGGARGVDQTAEDEGVRLGLNVEVYKAQWNKHGKAAGPIRNNLMLDTLDSKTDMVIAFWDGESKGTFHTISEADERHIPCEVQIASEMK